MVVVWQRADVDEWLAVMTNWLMVGRCPWCVEAKVKMIHSTCIHHTRWHASVITGGNLNSLNKEEELWKEVEVADFVVTALFYRWNRFTGTSFLLSAGWLYRDGLKEFNCCSEYSQGAWLWYEKNMWNGRRCVLHSYVVEGDMCVRRTVHCGPAQDSSTRGLEGDLIFVRYLASWWWRLWGTFNVWLPKFTYIKRTHLFLIRADNNWPILSANLGLPHTRVVRKMYFPIQ